MLQKLAKFIFKKEYDRILERDRALGESQKAMKRYADSLGIDDMLREKLVKLPKNVTYEEDYKEEELLNFYRKAKDILENEAFLKIITRLSENQRDLTWTEAKTLEAVNFGRAWVSGIIDVQEEVERLANLYDEAHKRGDSFDKFKVLDN
jgi:hypothetical protein